MSIVDKLTTIAENEQKVFDAGKQAEYDAFWDVYQNKGNYVNTQYMFSGEGWTPANFKPKYGFIPSAGDGYTKTFYYCCAKRNTNLLDLIDVAKKQNINMFQPANTYSSMFEYARILTIPTIDASTTRGNTAFTKTFYYADYTHTIEKIILEDNNDITSSYVTFTNTFAGMSRLANITFEGPIRRDISFSSSPLTVESAKNIIEHLENYTGTTKELTYKLTLKSTVWTALNNAEAPPSGETWQEYVTSLGWNYA